MRHRRHRRRRLFEHFLHRTDPAVISAMRKVCAPGKHPPVLTRAERAALDAWLAEREEMLIEAILHDGLRGSAASQTYGHDDTGTRVGI